MKLFLEDNPDQLTLPGLASLTHRLCPGVPYVLLHNSHYSVVIKRDSKLFALVTDQGLAREGCSWSTIAVDGQEVEFVDNKFEAIAGGPGRCHGKCPKHRGWRLGGKWCRIQ